jgi:hypothetical protein
MELEDAQLGREPQRVSDSTWDVVECLFLMPLRRQRKIKNKPHM